MAREATAEHHCGRGPWGVGDQPGYWPPARAREARAQLPAAASNPGRYGPEAPARKLSVDGYVRWPDQSAASRARVSVQRWQIVQWTAARGWRLGQIFEDSEPDRPADRVSSLRAALDRVESGESDGIVVVSLDQIGASLVDVIGSIERIEAAGGAFVSVSDGIDLTTPTGRLILRLLVSVAEWRPS